MDDIALKGALHEYVTQAEPPISLSSVAVVAAGRRSHRFRTAGAVLAGAAAVTLAVTGAVAVVPTLKGRPQQPGSALVVPENCAALPGFEAERRQSRVTCYLTQVIPEMLPGATFRRFEAQGSPKNTPPLHAYPSDTSVGGFDADAIVVDSEGTGTLVVAVSPASGGGAPTAEACRSKGICELRTAPNGVPVAVYTSLSEAGADRSRLGYTVYAYLGGTVILAGSANDSGDSDPRPPTRPRPPLGIDELIEIATAPELAVFS